MKYIHKEYNLNARDCVRVTLDKQANVRVMDSSNYNSFRRGGRHSYIGGLAESSPVTLSVPHSGHWHVVVDMGGYSGSVRASISIV